MLIILALLLAQTGTCKTGVNCQATSYRAVTNQPDAGAAFATTGNGYIQLQGVTAATKPLCNAARKGALQFIRYTNDSGYEVCNGIEWLGVGGSGGSGGNPFPGCTSDNDGGIICSQYFSTARAAQTSSFVCNNVTSSSPCLNNPVNGLEIFATVNDPTSTSVNNPDFILSARIADGGVERSAGYLMGLFNYERPVWWIDYKGGMRSGESGGVQTGLDFYGADGRITANNAYLYLRGATGLLTGSQTGVASTASLNLIFNAGTQVGQTYGDGAQQWTGVATGSLGTCNSGKKGSIQYDTSLNVFKYCDASAWKSLTPYIARVTLSAGTGTATVPSGSTCQCTDETAKEPVGCSVTATTLTVLGEGSDIINATCDY